ncbi:hypothetical protein AQUCO_05100044v1 [Aquilegia coerulea]|uniref:Glutaredoxin domain-containing protein n=1 Tax=Aquilegia coerulea TaxID=218851 RepID=A0A2G5CIX8_AQUCA|nr:hypothetical protein AQUCO_05100044v1 [Aquilegia coerulea]
MQQALPYRLWLSNPVKNSMNGSLETKALFNNVEAPSTTTSTKEGSRRNTVKNMVLENAVILFGKRGCCMCHAMKRLLLMLGVNPGVYEVDEHEEEAVINELMTIINQNRDGGNDNRPQFPSMFIGGKLFGGLDKLMAAHISGELVPMLKQAGALWL